MNKYYFTYGSNHTDKHGNSLGNCFSVIEAEDEEAARVEMVRLRDDKWFTSYLSPETAGVERHGLKMVSLEIIDTRELRKEEAIEAIVSGARAVLERRIAKLDELKDVIRKLPVELIPKCREYNGTLDIDYLTRDESKLALSSLGAGKWKKEINHAHDEAIDYTGKVNDVDVRLWAAGAPESFRVVEEEEVIPEQRVIRRKLICTPA